MRLSNIAGLFALLVCAQSLAGIKLYEDDNFRGRTFSARDGIENLKDVQFNDRASSLQIDREPWQLCTDAGFGGRCVVLEPGEYASLRSFNLNDGITSIRPMPSDDQPWGGGDVDRGETRDALVLFRDDNFSGDSVAINRDEPDLGRDNRMNDRASSVIVNHGEWELCADVSFGGRCERVHPGRYASLRSMGLNDSISSVRRIRRDSGYRGSGTSRGHNDWRYPPPPSSTSGDGPPPVVVMGRNNVSEVFFNGASNRCVVYYKDGRRVSNDASCNGSQIDRADVEMDRYLRGHDR